MGKGVGSFDRAVSRRIAFGRGVSERAWTRQFFSKMVQCDTGMGYEGRMRRLPARTFGVVSALCVGTP